MFLHSLIKICQLVEKLLREIRHKDMMRPYTCLSEIRKVSYKNHLWCMLDFIHFLIYTEIYNCSLVMTFVSLLQILLLLYLALFFSLLLYVQCDSL
jgi:hypothetical protein